MKKTIPITIAGTLFYIEEDAYQRLNEYLNSVKLHFASYPDSGDIIADIESRVAEQFLENSGSNKDKIVSIEEVEKLIKVMGNVEDFDDQENPHKSTSGDSTSQTKTRKLYRNPDDSIVAGVASGIAAYFGIDTLIVRLIFAVIVLAGGSGVLIYVILWFVMPEAKTPTEKLQMRGAPVTLESVNEMVKEKVDEVKKKRGTLGKVLAFPFVILSMVLKKIIPAIGKLIGFVITLSTIFGIFWLVFVLVLTLFNIHSPYMDFPLSQIISGPLFYLGLFTAFFAIFVPLLSLMFVGITLLKTKNSFKLGPTIALLTLWFVALIILGVVGSKVAPDIQNYIQTSPDYQQVTKNYDLKDFTGINASNSSNVIITQGPVFSVKATGRAKDLEEMNLQVKDGNLETGRIDKFHFCIFCISGNPKIEVTMPVVSKVLAHNSSHVSGQNIKANVFALELSNSSRADLEIYATSTSMQLENSSRANITGSSTTANITVQNSSRVNAPDFKITNAQVSAENSSRADVYVVSKLKATAKNSSSINYYGDPIVEQIISNSARVKKVVTAPINPTTTPESDLTPPFSPDDY